MVAKNMQKIHTRTLVTKHAECIAQNIFKGYNI